MHMIAMQMLAYHRSVTELSPSHSLSFVTPYYKQKHRAGSTSTVTGIGTFCPNQYKSLCPPC
jgi:hypothetical protein